MKTVREFALRVIESESLEEKLKPPPRDLPDEDRGNGDAPDHPGRPSNLKIVPGHEAKVPRLGGWADPIQRNRILHALANHELQATELFARALVSYPDAPPELRSELLQTLREEQVHTKLYLHRLVSFGGEFGEFPVSGLFWNRILETRTISEFLCALSLTFENANLDHAPEIAATARAHGDEETAKILDQVAKDEVRHVALGAKWVRAFAEEGESIWDAYRRQTYWPLHAGRARGVEFHPEPRRAAGLDEDFIRGLAETTRDVPTAHRRVRGGRVPGSEE